MSRVTTKTIEALKELKTLNCGDGLYLVARRVAAGGLSKIFDFRYTIRGKRRRMTLGVFDKVTLAKARELAVEGAKQVAGGIDPLEHRRSEEERALRTVEQAAAAYHAQYSEAWSARYSSIWINGMRRHAFPKRVGGRAFGTIPIDAITTPDVLAVIEPLWTTKPPTARGILSFIRAVIDFAATKGWRDPDKRNPAEWKGRIEHVLLKHSKVHTVEHFATLPLAKLPEFIRALDALPAEISGVCVFRDGGKGVQTQPTLFPITAAAIKLQILCACRPREAYAARWSEVDLARAVWTVSASRMKAGADHDIPLSAAALALLRGLPRKNEFVFPGRGADGGLSHNATVNLMRRLDFKADDGRRAVAHGFRSLFTDWALEAGYRPDLVLRAIAHTVMKKSDKPYARTKLLEARRPMLEHWARVVIDGPSDEVNVLNFTPRRSESA